MEEIIEKIQKEVDDQNKLDEIRKKKIAAEKKELEFDQNNLLTINLSGLENAVKFLLENLAKLNKDIDKAQKEIKSRSYIVDKVHKEGNERAVKIKEMDK
jgi:hypothetical protein